MRRPIELPDELEARMGENSRRRGRHSRRVPIRYEADDPRAGRAFRQHRQLRAAARRAGLLCEREDEPVEEVEDVGEVASDPMRVADIDETGHFRP